jgi:glycosyltransferase involved in cell wall biosynthesis
VSVAVLIPAFRPGRPLLDLLARLSSAEVESIIVVDDGSGPEFAPVFEEARRFPKVHLLRHAVNLGKGAALRTGMNYALCEVPQAVGVVTADADGQHHPEDILRVAALLDAKPGHLVLGARQFEGRIPLRSRIGNTVTRAVFRLLVGEDLQDTQTGLRGIPRALLSELLKSSSRGYEFELEMLISAKHNGWPLAELPIRTIYEPGNKSSHFNPLLDSIKAYAVLLRFTGVSVVTALLDNLVFYLVYTRIGNITVAQAAARSVAVLFQYNASRSAVFLSRGRHKVLFPRFLLLAFANALVSYAMIRVAISKAGMSVVFAKPLVEGLLFAASFLLQREFVFRAPSRVAAPPPEALLSPRARLAGRIVFFLSLGVTLWGVLSGGFLRQTLWQPMGLYRLKELTLAYAAWSAAFLFAAPAWFVPATVGVLLAISAVALGPLAPLAVLLFLFSCFVTGALLLPGRESSDPIARLLQLLVGIGVWMSALWVAARFPINYPAVYLVALLVPLAIRPQVTRACLGACASLVRPLSLPRRLDYWAVALAGFPLLCHLVLIPKPEMGSDALATHLVIPAWIQFQHFWPFDFRHFAWAMAPLGADWCYTAVYLLGGEFAARLLNFAYVPVIAGLLYFTCRRFLPRAAAFLLAGLFLSTPLVQLVTGSMFVDNLWAAFIFGAVLAIERFRETGVPRWLYAAGVLFGAALATKFGTLAFLAPAAAFAAWELADRKGTARPAAIAAGLFLLVGLPVFVVSYVKTGNPFFPYMNAVFKSPWYDTARSFVDHRYKEPLTLATPVDIVFQTHKYLEGKDGGLGLHYLLLVPLTFLALGRKRPWLGLLALGTACVASVLTFQALAYVRYIYPALALFLVAAAVALARVRAGDPLLFRTVVASLLAAFATNIYLLPSSGYWQADFFMNPFRRGAADRYIQERIPERKLIEYLNDKHPGEPVTFFGSGDIAGLRATAYPFSWHGHTYMDQAAGSRTPNAYGRLAQQLGIRHFVTLRGLAWIENWPAIAGFLSQYTEIEYSVGGFDLRRLKPGSPTRWAWDVPQTVVGTCPPGLVDDSAPQVRASGPWDRLQKYGDACGGTVTYTDAANAELTFPFIGTGVTYVFVRAHTGGMVEADIDGVKRGVVDLYSPAIEWQSQMTFDGLPRGRHTLTLHVLHQKHPKSAGFAVNADGFVVRD